MRLFVAIDLADDMKKSIVKLMHELKLKGVKGNFAPVQNLHLTLAFIGETQEKDSVTKALQTIKYKPFKLSTSELGHFSDILYLGTRSGQALSTLVSDIRTALKNAGIPFDDKKFVPHITLVRKASNGSVKIPMPKSEMMVKKISLMKSENVKGKMVYTEIFAF